MDWKREDTLWRIIQRYDTYFGSTNAKAAFLIGFNTFVLGFVLVQVGNIDDLVPTTAPRQRAVLVALASAVAVATLVSLGLVIAVVVPYLRSNKKPGLYHSIIYFEDVAEHDFADDYLRQVKDYTGEQVVEDLCRQAHVLARGLARKFVLLRRAMIWNLVAQVPLLATLLVFVVWAHLTS